MECLPDKLKTIIDGIEQGRSIRYDEACYAANHVDLIALLAAAENIRGKYHQKHIELCGILNAKSGRCSENCRALRADH
jgi:biotin synthase